MTRHCTGMYKSCIHSISLISTGNHVCTAGKTYRLTISCCILFYKCTDYLQRFFYRFRFLQAQLINPVFSQPEKRSSVVNHCIRKCIQLSINRRRLQERISITFIHFLDRICCTLLICFAQIFNQTCFDQSKQVISSFHDKHIRNIAVFNCHIDCFFISITILQLKGIDILNIKYFLQISCICIVFISISYRKI